MLLYYLRGSLLRALLGNTPTFSMNSIKDPSFIIKNKDGRSQSWRVMGHFPVDEVIDYGLRFLQDGFITDCWGKWLPKDIDYLEIVNL